MSKKTKKPKHDIDDDPTFDTGKEAMNRAHNNQLRLFMERIERLEDEKKGIADDIRDVYAEAKSNGYDTKIMRIIYRLRKMEAHDRAEMEALVDTYKAELGID